MSNLMTVGAPVAGRYERTPMTYIEPCPWTTTTMNKRQQKALEESLKRYGQLQPIVVYVREDRKPPNVNVTLVDGDKRLAALQAIGALEVDAINIGVRDENYAREVHLALNLNRGKPKADALADAIEAVVEAPKTERGKALAEVALTHVVPLAKAPTKMVEHLRSRGRPAPVKTNPAAKPSWVDFKFKVAHSAARVCDDALSHIEQTTNVKRPQAFELICADYLAGARRGKP